MNCNKLKLWKVQACYILKHRRAYPNALCGLVALLFLNYLVGGKLIGANTFWWNNFLDPIVGLGTLFTAIAVWFGEMNQDWLSSLPKQLTVEFYYQGRLFMRCENADLASEADIRALGQQIGGQMAAKDEKSKPELLLLKAPAIQYSDGKLNSDNTALCYQAIFELTALPEKLEQIKDDNVHLYWTPPFDHIIKKPNT
ncbi:MAG: hypothetical protein PHE55_22420 [Methylococcaceae bacterium]|nr:hypothetical protein [Methylococcaceae bacterium]